MSTVNNSDIALKYKVSKAAVTYWIQDAKDGKNNLQLELIKNKFQVIDNNHNHSELLRLSESGKKFRRNVNHENIEPKSEFYNIFSEDEIVEIIRDLEVYKEINYKFSYKNGGAGAWDDFYKKNISEGTYLTHVRVKNLLEKSFDIIVRRIPEDIKINVIEIGPGNSLPVEDFLKKLNQLGRLSKYTVIDISPSMTEISRKNILSWFPDLKFTSYICDVEQTKLNKIFEQEKLNNSEKTVNLVINVGSTIGNHRDRISVLNNIRDGLRKDDIFILSNTTDLEDSKSELNYLKMEESLDQDIWIPAMLNFNVANCSFSTRYDEKLNCKIESFFLEKDYTLSLKELSVKKEINFYKGEEIIIWRHYMTKTETLFQELSNCGLNLAAFNTENDLSHALMICQLAK